MSSAPTGPHGVSQAGFAARDLAVLIVAGLVTLGWDFSGSDLAVMRLFGTSRGFPWRDAFVTSRLLHDGGRLLGWGVALAWLAHAVMPRWPGPHKAQRVGWLSVALALLLVVPAIKHASLTSCPWDLAEFGGHAWYVSHWAGHVADGGAGHCFPSGHAATAFAFLAGHFLLRPQHPGAARAWLAAVCSTGLAFGIAQVARGAHYPSHVLWTAWLCWTGCVAAAHGPRWLTALAGPLRPSGIGTDCEASPPSRPR